MVYNHIFTVHSHLCSSSLSPSFNKYYILLLPTHGRAQQGPHASADAVFQNEMEREREREREEEQERKPERKLSGGWNVFRSGERGGRITTKIKDGRWKLNKKKMNRTNTHTEKQYCQKNSLFFFSGTLTGLLGPHRSRSVTDQTLELPPEPNMKEKSSKTN